MWFSHQFRDCRTKEKIENLAFTWSPERMAVASAGSFVITTVLQQNPRSHHKGATGRVILTVRTKQAKSGQVRNKERNTGEHREPQADVEQQGWETPPYKPGPGPPAGLREGLARELEAGGPERRPRGPCPAERGGRAVAPPGTPAVGARRASAAGSEELEAATNVGRRLDAMRTVHRASESWRWGGAVDNLP